MFREKLITHCAPTLAGIKTGSLFSYRMTPAVAQCKARWWDFRLRKRGVRIALLRVEGGRALIYAYRPGMLRTALDTPAAARFLAQYGYPATGTEEQALERLRSRMRGNTAFPHEIGLFLGYPVEDVQGFIEHQGNNFKYCGYWKVYGDEMAARRAFQRYAACTSAYHRLFQSGRTVKQLTVAA